MTPPVILTVSTLGRIDPLRTLLRSLDGQLRGSDRVVLVAQGRIEEVEALVAEFAPVLGERLLMTTSERGASLGRNTGVALASVDLSDALLMFPNDTTAFPVGSLEAIRAGMGDAPAGAVTVVTPSGPRFVLPPSGTTLNSGTVWQVIEMGLVIRLPLFRALGGFDSALGTGAPTPWQAGEVTDLLMRARLFDPRLDQRFTWLHRPDAVVTGIEETASLNPRERRRKLRAYGRGVGRIYRDHDFPAWRRWGFVLAGLLIGLRRSDEYAPLDGITAFLGRLEGVGGILLDRSRRHAVER